MRKNMEYIRTKWTFFTICMIFYTVIGALILLFFLFIIGFSILVAGVVDYGVILLLIIWFVLFLVVRKNAIDLKRLIIRKESLTYYSLLRPFGKTVYFDDYIRKAILKNTSLYPSLHRSWLIVLINKKNRTAFRINFEYAREGNGGEIIYAIPLKEIRYKPTLMQNITLKFGGNITIKKKK